VRGRGRFEGEGDADGVGVDLEVSGGMMLSSSLSSGGPVGLRFVPGVSESSNRDRDRDGEADADADADEGEAGADAVRRRLLRLGPSLVGELMFGAGLA